MGVNRDVIVGDISIERVQQAQTGISGGIIRKLERLALDMGHGHDRAALEEHSVGRGVPDIGQVPMLCGGPLGASTVTPHRACPDPDCASVWEMVRRTRRPIFCCQLIGRRS